jgi:DNA-binding MarR family transcriptional regulator
MQIEGTAESTMELAELLDDRLVGLSKMLRAQAADAGLSITALSVLRRLDDGGPCRVTELAAQEAIAQPSMTALVGRLAERGLAERRADSADGRAVLVGLTAAGRNLLAKVRHDRTGVLAERLESMDDSQRSRITAAVPALDRLLSQGD